LTLKSLREVIAGRDDLPQVERTELCSSITRLGEIAGVALSDTPADGPTLRALFASASWQLADLLLRFEPRLLVSLSDGGQREAQGELV
jgi:hypothetical protein